MSKRSPSPGRRSRPADFDDDDAWAEIDGWDVIPEPTGAVPGQAAKIFTIFALHESVSFTDPENGPLLTTIEYSTEESPNFKISEPARVRKTGCLSRCLSRCKGKWKNIIACLCLWIAFVLANIAYSIMAPFFPQVADEKGVSPVLIGVIISSSPFCAVFLSPVAGYLLPHIRVWMQVCAGLILVGVSYSTLAFVDRIENETAFILTAVVLRSIEGMGTAVLSTVIFSTFPKLFPKSVGTLVGLFELGSGFGCAVGPSLGGVLYSVGGFKLPFLSIGGAILLFVVPCTFLVRNLSVEFDKKKLPTRVVFGLFTDGLFVALVLIVALTYSPVQFFAPALPSFLGKEYNQTPLLIGVLYFVGAFAYFASALPIGPLTDKVGHNRKFSVLGLVLLCVSYLMVGVPYYLGYKMMWVIYIAYVVMSLGSALSVIPIYSDLLFVGGKYMQTGDSKAALASFVSGLITSSGCFSLVFAPIFGGALSTVLPLPMVAVIVAMVMLAQAALVAGMSTINRLVG